MSLVDDSGACYEVRGSQLVRVSEPLPEFFRFYVSDRIWAIPSPMVRMKRGLRRMGYTLSTDGIWRRR